MDCLEGMKMLEDNSVDSIVTDPPYNLTSITQRYGKEDSVETKHPVYGRITKGFMGKEWDGTGITFTKELWKECLRVLKPGGYLLAFGGTRTYHRMACAIEDAGFEIRDCIQWIYGSGFPKSMDISKQIDKAAGAEREVISEVITKSGGMGHIMKTNLQQGYRPNDYYEETGNVIKQTLPATPEAKQWNGWGTALKPANEPIIVARKPISEKTVAQNVLKWGTGGINIDGCRIESNDNLTRECKGLASADNEGWKRPWNEKAEKKVYGSTSGRWPANVILDEDAGRLLDEQSGTKQTTRHMSYKRGNGEFIDNIPSQPEKDWFVSENGGASRFFYCAKASKKERGANNNHPTVKPISLIQYLIRLVTPPNGTVLDPFGGSGTTALAAGKEKRNYILFELNEDYCNIANQRIQFV